MDNRIKKCFIFLIVVFAGYILTVILSGIDGPMLSQENNGETVGNENHHQHHVMELSGTRLSQPYQRTVSRKENQVLTNTYTKMKFGSVYILGVAGGNTTDDASWNIFKVYGAFNWSLYKHEGISCCFKYSSFVNKSNIVRNLPTNAYLHRYINPLRGFHFTCPNKRHTSGSVPVGVGLSIQDLSCSDRYVTYVKPYFPLKEAGNKLAIGTKMAYGNVSAEWIIEWMETYKSLGVDKILTYVVKQINEEALKVLEYYSSTDMLDLYHHEPAAAGSHAFRDQYPKLKHVYAKLSHQYDIFLVAVQLLTFQNSLQILRQNKVGGCSMDVTRAAPVSQGCHNYHYSVIQFANPAQVTRVFHPPNPQKRTDNHLVLLDSFERMSGYAYFGIIDHDEFLIPSRGRSLKQLLADLYRRFPQNTAGFVFQSQYYYLTWGPTSTSGELLLESYVNRTKFGPHLDRQKNIYKPKYIAFGGAHTHYTRPVRDYRLQVVPSEEAFIRHYRQCLTDMYEECLYKFKRVKDESIAKWSQRIKQKVLNVRKIVLNK